MKWKFNLLPNKEQTQADQELKILEEDIVSARDFIRKNYKNYFQAKKKIPIYLILGPSRFGKTTILSKSGLDLINVNNELLDNITPTKYCSFWFTKEALYIDTAGTYTKPDITKPRNDIIWQGFIKLLQKYFGKSSIAGVLIILDLPAVTQDTNLLNKTLFCIRERIYETAALVKNIHAHIIFTKCDRLLGFTEFFSLLDTTERSQPFGISFSLDKKRELIPEFDTKFDKLLKHLNNRMIENLQKTIRPHERALIKIFPSQLNHLRQTFIDVIEKTPNSNQIKLSGIYFTSSIQTGPYIDPIKDTLLHILKLKEKPIYALEAKNNRSYFIEEIFKNTISRSSPSPKKNPLNFSWLPAWQTGYIYAFIFAVVIISISFAISYRSYYQNLAIITQTNLLLQNQHVNNPTNLFLAIEQLEKKTKSLWLSLGINKIKPLHQYLAKLHEELFARNLAWQVENYLNAPKNQETTNILNLYHGLQIYLMLGNPDKLDPASVKNWFSSYWAKLYGDDNEQSSFLLMQLNIILQHKLKVELNQQLIATVRETLKKLSPTQLIYILLENTYLNKNVEIDATRTISKMYIKENFHKIYNETIPNLVTNIPQYDWVLGDLESQTKDLLNNDTINNVQELYIEQYVFAWEKMFDLDTTITFKDLPDAVTKLKSIAATQETLTVIAKKIKQNITINNPPQKLIKEINEKLPSLDTFDAQAVQSAFDKLINYLSTLAKAADPNQASFVSLVKYLQEVPTNHPVANFKSFLSHQTPLIQKYLSPMATNSWRVIFAAAHNHIKQAWNRTIMPKYKETLENKYPLFKESSIDTSIAEFHNFFGPGGIIDNFFNLYIEPLVKIDKTNWTWQTIDGVPLNFPPTFLEIFLRAALIQKMFYATQTEAPKVEFTLTPETMTPGTQGFTLSVDGQKVSFSNEEKKTQTLVWPGPQHGSVTIYFISTQGKYITTSEISPWAWFKILDKANVTTSNNTRNFELTFDLNGNAVKYTLTAAQAVNPFIPDIISNFRCQEQ